MPAIFLNIVTVAVLRWKLHRHQSGRLPAARSHRRARGGGCHPAIEKSIRDGMETKDMGGAAGTAMAVYRGVREEREVEKFHYLNPLTSLMIVTR
jgi:hypothetical protein